MVMRRGSLAGHGRYRPKVLLVEPSPPAGVNWAKTQASFQPVQAQAGASPSLIQQKLGFDLLSLSLVFPSEPFFFFSFLFPCSLT